MNANELLAEELRADIEASERKHRLGNLRRRINKFYCIVDKVNYIHYS